MNLEKAIDILENVIADEVIGTYCIEIQKTVECSKNCENEDCFLQQAIDTVLKELNTLQMNYKLLEEKFDGSAEEKVDKLTEELETRYNKGYQDGFHSARYDKYMNEIHGEGESAIKYLVIEKEGYLRGYQDGFKQAKFDCEMDKLDGR